MGSGCTKTTGGRSDNRIYDSVLPSNANELETKEIPMRLPFVRRVLSVLGLGCNRTDKAAQKVAQPKLEQTKLEQTEDELNNFDTEQGTSASEFSPVIDMDVSAIVNGGNQFALDLYQQLRSAEGNLFFSPASISTALAMTSAGASGETAAEMAALIVSLHEFGLLAD
ncbi:MAG: serpin family protein [Planctomycetota bacterium]